MLIFALIPANGKGSRYGMPKVDAVFNGITFQQHIENTLSETVVRDWLVIRDIDSHDMLGSIRYGMHRIMTQGIWPDCWLIWPIDHPFVKAETINALIDCYRVNPKSVIVPQLKSNHDSLPPKRGHPIILPGGLMIPNIEYINGLRTMLEKAKLNKVYIEVDDPGIIENINSPEDVRYV
jgi:CTP:molybdopterin cytidylyltransferase MocA